MPEELFKATFKSYKSFPRSILSTILKKAKKKHFYNYLSRGEIKIKNDIKSFMHNSYKFMIPFT